MTGAAEGEGVGGYGDEGDRWRQRPRGHTIAAGQEASDTRRAEPRQAPPKRSAQRQRGVARNAGRPHASAPGPASDPRLAVARGARPADALAEARPPLVSAAALVGEAASLGARMAGYGPQLAPYFADERVTDVLVNEPGRVWVDRGCGLHPHPVDLDGEGLRALAVSLAAAAGQRLDNASPIVDGTLPDGTRLHAVLPPLSSPWPAISLRTFRAKRLAIDDLVASGTIAAPLEPVMRALVAARASTFISGATGSGKTTLLGALLGLVPRDQRILCIEEVSELRPDHPHVVHLQQRRSNVQDVGEITMSDLTRAAMRMRPDRIVLGECRGGEVREVLSAMNTGHEGGWATIHANAAHDVPARLYALGALAGMTPATVAAQAAAGIDALVHVRRASTGAGPGRWVSEIAVPRREGAELAADVAIRVSREGVVTVGRAWDGLAERLGIDAACLAGERGRAGAGVAEARRAAADADTVEIDVTSGDGEATSDARLIATRAVVVGSAPLREDA